MSCFDSATLMRHYMLELLHNRHIALGKEDPTVFVCLP